MPIFHAEDFAIYRGQTIAVSGAYTITVSGALGVPCPSGWGWAISRGTASAASEVRMSFVSPMPSNRSAQAAIFTLEPNPASTTWVWLLRANRNATNEFDGVQYQPSTNTLRFARDLTFIVGTAFPAPADVSQPFEIAYECERDATAGWAKVWLNGELVLDVSNVNTGTNSGALGNVQLHLPGNLAAGGDATASNWIAWDPDLRSYPGRRRLQRLAPNADISLGWNTPASNRFASLADAGPGVTGVAGTGTQGDVYGIEDLTDTPTVIETLMYHSQRNVTSGMNLAIMEAAGEQLFPLVATWSRIEIESAFNLLPWNVARVNNVSLGHRLTGSAVTVWAAHLLVVRSLDSGGPAPPVEAVGRAFIISSGP